MGIKSHSVENVFSKNIKMLEYAHLKTDVKELVDYTVMNNLKANSVLRLRRDVKPKFETLWQLPWTDIIELREALVENNLQEAIKLVFGIDKIKFLQLGIFNTYAAYLWIAKEFMEMNRIEIEQLSMDMDDDEKEAGTEDLQDFGYAVALDGLAKGNLLEYDKWLVIPYNKIFRKLLLDKTKYEINKNIQRNASRKLTTNG